MSDMLDLKITHNTNCIDCLWRSGFST